MHSTYLSKIYINIISVLFVYCQEFGHQNHLNPYNRRIIRPNSEHIHKQQLPQQNAVFPGRQQQRPITIGFEDVSQRPTELRHVRQQMPYQSNDPHMRPNNARHHVMSHMTHVRQQNTNEMPIHLPPKYIQNPNSFSRRHPEIIENVRHLRIQSPLEREEEFEDDLQNIDRNNNNNNNNNFRQIQNKGRDRGQQNFAFNDKNNANRDPRHLRNFGQDRKFFPNLEQGESGLKMLFPKAREETRVNGFETFTTQHEHKEIDKIYPKHERERDSHNFPSINDLRSEEPSEDYRPENEAEFQRNLNLLPPVNDGEERRQFKPYESRPQQQQHNQNRQQIPKYFRNHFRNSEPNHFYSAQNQQNQNKANHQNIGDFQQSIQHNPSFDSMSVGPNGQTFYRDNKPNEFDFRRNSVNKQKNRFQQFYGNDYQRQTTQKPFLNHNTFGRPVKKEIEIVREITEILPSDELHSNDEHFDPSPPIATPSPPASPDIYMPSFDDKMVEEKPTIGDNQGQEHAKEDNFYDDDDERQSFLQKNKDIDTEDEDSNNEKKSNKSKFEKEVDLSADDLENYFDREFANEHEKEEEAQKKIAFDDEPKESNALVSKKDKTDDPEDVDIELEYKSATDFLKNHDDFLNKIEKENEKFRKKTEDKVEKEEDKEDKEDKEDEENEAELQQKPNVDDGEKELDENEKKDAEEVVAEEKKTEEKDDQKAEDKTAAAEEEVATDSNEEDKKDKKESDAEDDEESETKEVTEKEVTEKEDKKVLDNNEENQKSEEKNEEQEEDNGTKDEEKDDNTESDETNESETEKEVKSDKCLESNCDKELLKEESKESSNTQELKSKQEKKESGEPNEEQVVEQKTSDEMIVTEKSSSIKTKPTEEKPNRNRRISQSHNFSPFFIDLKRINPNKSNIRKGLGNNESQTSWTTSATISSSPKQSVSPPTLSNDPNNGKPTDNNKTVETKRVVNSIKDIIRSQNQR